MITITVTREDTLCDQCGQPRRNCKCFAAGRPRQKNRLEKIEDELKQLALQHPDVLDPKGFTSKATGQRRKVLLAVRRQYYKTLREMIEIRKCIFSTSEKSLSPDVVKLISDVTKRSARKSN